MDISDVNYEIFRRAIPYVEVEAEKARGEDGFIRTKTIPPEGSTAYGPYGMTLGRVKDFLKRKKHITKNYNEEQLDYIERFLEQGKLFNKHGYNEEYINANPGSKDPRKLPGYDPRFDYGGRGILDTERDKELYFEVFDPEVFDTYKESGGNSLKAAANWHGSKKPNGNKIYQGKIAAAEQKIRSQMAKKTDAFENDSLMQLLGDGGDSAEPEQSFLDWIISLFNTRENGN